MSGLPAACEGRARYYSLYSITDMLLEHDSGILALIWEEEDVDPESMSTGREVKEGSQLSVPTCRERVKRDRSM